MKTTFENIQLSLNTERNSLPIDNKIFGSIKINEDLTEAEFQELELTFLGKRKRINILHKERGNVVYNTETGEYRISVIINTDDAFWVDKADDTFCKCLDFLARRTNA